MEKHKAAWMSNCIKLFTQYEAEDERFLSHIITGDEAVIHHHDSKTKPQSSDVTSLRHHHEIRRSKDSLLYYIVCIYLTMLLQ
jgi:hypothetical protein